MLTEFSRLQEVRAGPRADHHTGLDKRLPIRLI